MPNRIYNTGTQPWAGIADLARFNPELIDELIRRPMTFTVDKGKPPYPGDKLPSAKVTPQEMIANVVRNAKTAADAQFIRHCSASVRTARDRPLTTDEHMVASDELRRTVERRVADEIHRIAPPINVQHDMWGGLASASCDVVVMTRANLMHMIEGIGERVLEEARKNGFIR